MEHCFFAARRRKTMTDHKIGTREEWLAARLELLKEEKALTRSTVLRPTRAWRLLPICSEDVRSFSSITSCSAPSTEAAARHALRSRTALTASQCTLSTTTSR